MRTIHLDVCHINTRGSMTIKRKDFQKAAAFVHEFLLKLNVDVESAELRDALNLALLHMQRHYRNLRAKQQNHNGRGGGAFLTHSLRGLSPMTPFKDTPDKFQWKWTEMEQRKVAETLPVELSKELSTVPVILRIAKEGEDNRLLQLLETEPECINEVDALGRNALMYAVHFGHLDTVQHLLERNIDINATTVDGATAVHRACYDGSHEALQLLIEYSADLGVLDGQGRAPVHWATASVNLKCLELLLERGVDVNVRDLEGMTPSMWACRTDHIEHFSELSARESQPGSDTDGFDRDCNGRTWLHWSVRRTEPLECLRTLMTEDAASLRDDEGKTVTHVAAEQGSLASVKAILEIAGKDSLEHRDSQNRTPLHVATMGGHGEVVNFLLSQEVDLALVDNWGYTAWDYARVRQLHYCMLIIASYIRQRNKNNVHPDNGASEDPYDHGDGVHIGKRNTEENLGMGNLQINGEGGPDTHFFQNAPVPLPIPPSCPPTPRTPRGPATPRLTSSATALSQAQTAVPPSRENPNYHPRENPNYHSPHSQSSRSASCPTPRGYAVKRSPSAPMEWVNGDGRSDGYDRDISSAGSGGKRKKNNDHDSTDKAVSLSSLDSGDNITRLKKQDGKGLKQDTLDHGLTLEDTAINDEDFESMSMDGMDISDLEGDAGTLRGPADVHQTKTPSPRHRQAAPSSGVSQYHAPSPPNEQLSKHPAQPSVPCPREWEEENEAPAHGMRPEPSHVNGTRPQPTPRARPGTVTPAKSDDRVVPSGLLSPIPPMAAPVKKKKKKKKKDRAAETTPPPHHDLSPMVNTPRGGYAAPIMAPQSPVPVPQRQDRPITSPPPYQQQGHIVQGHPVHGHVGHDLDNQMGPRPRKKTVPLEQQHEEKFMLDENARMLTQMLTTTGGAMSQSPLAPPIPQAQPRQKQPPQQQQRRSPKSHIGGHMSHHSDDRLSPQGEDGKFSAYTRPGLPPGGQLEQGQRTGTRFGSRSPTAGGTGQSRQREVTRGPALAPPSKRRIGTSAQHATSSNVRERHPLPTNESKPPSGKTVSWSQQKNPANGRFPMY